MSGGAAVLMLRHATPRSCPHQSGDTRHAWRDWIGHVALRVAVEEGAADRKHRGTSVTGGLTPRKVTRRRGKPSTQLAIFKPLAKAAVFLQPNDVTLSTTGTLSRTQPIGCCSSTWVEAPYPRTLQEPIQSSQEPCQLHKDQSLRGSRSCLRAGIFMTNPLVKIKKNGDFCSM